ncbi:MAG: 5'-3' exonuclease H3TH domain-containing protein, partial [Oscillospiraceae bacterium]
DILGTISKTCHDNGDFCYIATGDRDSFQLVNESVNVRLATTKAGASLATLIDEKYIEEKFGLTPPMLIDVKALMGDASDNIPGVAGIGEKTALALIAEFKTLDGVYENINKLSIKKGVREKLLANKEMAYKSYALAKICLEVPIDVKIEELPRASMDEEKTVAILRDLELFSIIKRLKLTDIPQKEEETCEENEKTYELKPPTAENYNKILSRSLFYFLPAFKDEEIVGLTLLGDFLVRLTPEADCFYEVVSKLNDMAENAVTAETKDWYRFLYRKGITPKLCKFDVSLALYITAPSMKSYTSKDIAEALGFPNITDETSACSLLPKIYKILKAKTEENKQEELLFQMEQPLSRVLASMEVLGFCLD